MAEWEQIPLSDDEIVEMSDYDYSTEPNLAKDVQAIHSEFMAGATHLNDVENLHKQTLVNAGMIPEDHISHTEPSLTLQWFVDELNGKLNPDGLTIPMLGVEYDNVKLFAKKSSEKTEIKLEITDSIGEKLNRKMFLPDNKGADSLKVNFFNNRLHLRW